MTVRWWTHFHMRPHNHGVLHDQRSAQQPATLHRVVFVTYCGAACFLLDPDGVPAWRWCLRVLICKCPFA
jgi:hypothetical protein